MTDTDQRPFHESIVNTIDEVVEGVFPLRLIADLIKRTKVPKNHDAIAAAWTRKVAESGLNNDFGVVESLMAQKDEAEKKEAEATT